MVQVRSAAQEQEATWLLHSVAEQLKVPLTTIARAAELNELMPANSQPDLGTIRTHAAAALTLVDSYLFGLQLMRNQAELLLEPVSVASILTEAAHELEGLAKQYDTKLELVVAGKYGPVMAHRFGLKAAVLALGYALLEGSAKNSKGTERLVLATHRTAQGISAGLYGNYEGFSAHNWLKATRVKTDASQPFTAMSGNSAGLFVADTILGAMSAKLRMGKYRHRQGLATTLQLSQQLTFV